MNRLARTKGRDIKTIYSMQVKESETRMLHKVFYRATDYPQEIRERGAVRDFVKELAALGKDGEAILSGNVGKLIKQPARAA